jgi:hypothetical protein
LDSKFARHLRERCSSIRYPAFIQATFWGRQAYLAAGRGKEAAAELQKILDRSGMVWNCWTAALARLGVARANTLQMKACRGADAEAARVRALAAYKDFLTLSKISIWGIIANELIDILKFLKNSAFGRITSNPEVVNVSMSTVENRASVEVRLQRVGRGFLTNKADESRVCLTSG